MLSYRDWLLALAVLIPLCLVPRSSALADQQGPNTLHVSPPVSDEPLVNPGMGLYEYGVLDPAVLAPDAWYTPLISIGYFRDNWADIEPDGPNTDHYEAYFGPIFDLWVNKLGKRVSFRFMSTNYFARPPGATPKWVYDQGVPFVRHPGASGEQLDPVYWDDRYLRLQEQFIARLGKYLDGRSGLEFIDIGCIGSYGEMHLARWTQEELLATGYTEDRYIATHRRIIDAFATALPHTRVFLNVGGIAAINDYAALRGLHFRQDGLTPNGPSADVGNRFYRPYARRGVICQYEFNSGYDEMLSHNWGIRDAFNKGLEDPISYLHLNLTDYAQLANPPAELREAILDAARRIGFRFVFTDLTTNRAVTVGPGKHGRIALDQLWRNDGVAPCYDSYALRWHLVASDGRVVVEGVSYPRIPTTQWWPGETVAVHSLVRVPPDTKPGRYLLKVSLVKPEDPDLALQLGIAGGDAQGRYPVAEMEVRAAPARPEIDHEDLFERTTGTWTTPPGMTLSLGTEAHSGKRALLIQGTEPGNSWSYAATKPFAVRPYTRYRLSAWMKVDAIAPEGAPPYIKLGVYAAGERHLGNFDSSTYDPARMGEWQQIVTYAETSGEAETALIAIEKGVRDVALTATIRLDDVKLEVLEAP